MAYIDYLPEDIKELYEIHDYKHAAAILANEFPDQFNEICSALRTFKLTEENITARGGSESQIPKNVSNILRPLGWKEGQLKAKLMVDEEVINFDTHKIDYVKGRVAFDLEWNSKDQTYDRDLYAFRAFFDYNKISVGVLLTRSNQLDPLFKRLRVFSKYGASTTQMAKLLPRLNSGRNGGCPVLVFGITPKVIVGNVVIPSDFEHVVQSANAEEPNIDADDLKNILDKPNES
jgi:hypothetical protein